MRIEGAEWGFGSVLRLCPHGRRELLKAFFRILSSARRFRQRLRQFVRGQGFAVQQAVCPLLQYGTVSAQDVRCPRGGGFDQGADRRIDAARRRLPVMPGCQKAP